VTREKNLLETNFDFDFLSDLGQKNWVKSCGQTFGRAKFGSKKRLDVTKIDNRDTFGDSLLSIRQFLFLFFGPNFWQKLKIKI
jgi:hypothetical protein